MGALRRLFSHPGWVAKRALIVSLVAVAARIATFGNPIIDTDESFYLFTAQSMLHGAVPYVDIWDRKPVGLFVLYLLPALAPGAGAYLAYQLLALVFVILTALIVARLADRAGWQAGALPAALTYILWINLAEGQGGQSPVFYNLFMVAAAWAVARVIGEARPGKRLGLGLTAMILAGISLQIKYSVVFEGVFFGLFLLFQEWKFKTRLPRITLIAVILATTALIPTALALGVFAWTGHFDAYFYANFISIFDRHSEAFAKVADNFAVIVAILTPLLVLAWWRLPQRGATQQAQGTAIFLKGWLASSVIGVLVFGTYFVHYSLPVMVPAACCAAGFFALHRHGRKTAAIMLVLVAIAGQILIQIKEHNRGDNAQIRAIARQIGQGPGCLFDYSGQTILYELTGRCWLSRYVLSSHLNHNRETGAIGVPQETEVKRILDGRPDVILMAPQSGENIAVHRMIYARLAKAYHLEAKMPLGKAIMTIYRLNGAPSPK